MEHLCTHTIRAIVEENLQNTTRGMSKHCVAPDPIQTLSGLPGYNKMFGRIEMCIKLSLKGVYDLYRLETDYILGTVIHMYIL